MVFLPAALAAIASTCAGALAYAGRYEQRFNFGVGTTNLCDGSALTQNCSENGTPVAGVADADQRELQQTAQGVTGTRSALRLPDVDPGSAVSAFSARWTGQVTGTSLADGLSLNFGALPSDLVSTALRQEDGYGTRIRLDSIVSSAPAVPVNQRSWRRSALFSTASRQRLRRCLRRLHRA